MNTWTPLWSGIVDSSIWSESDLVVKIFVTMLALKDSDHVCRLSAYQIASRAKKTEVEVLEALKVLSSPDLNRIEPQPHEGRRISMVEDGWLVLNGDLYRKKISQEMTKARNRRAQAAFRERASTSDRAGEEPVKNTAAENLPDVVSEWIEKIYLSYPRKEGKKQAFSAIRKALTKIGPEELLSAVQTYALSRVGEQSKYTPHPASWFNDERWKIQASASTTSVSSIASARVPIESWKPTPEQIRIGNLKSFQRGDHPRPWSVEEIEAYNRIAPVDPDDISKMEEFYNFTRDFKWESLTKLLQNWNSMMDNARSFKHTLW